MDVKLNELHRSLQQEVQWDLERCAKRRERSLLPPGIVAASERVRMREVELEIEAKELQAAKIARISSAAWDKRKAKRGKK